MFFPASRHSALHAVFAEERRVPCYLSRYMLWDRHRQWLRRVPAQVSRDPVWHHYLNGQSLHRWDSFRNLLSNPEKKGRLFFHESRNAV